VGGRPIADITTDDIRQQQARMIHAKETLPNGETRLKWTPATINRYFSALRRIFTLAVIDGKISRHPMKGVKFCRNPNRTAFSQMWN